MLTTRELQDKIIQLKKEKNACILVHAYQSHDIWEVADYVGDSFGLSEKAAASDADIVIMCGVRFMAETVNILAPDKTAILSNPDADCPMARQYDAAAIRRLKEENPGCAVVAYINTTADLKTEADVCVTSSSAVKIVRDMPQKDILFVPDGQLGSWVADQVPEKNIKLVRGGCPVHMALTGHAVAAAKEAHPDALLLVHPESTPEVASMADYVGSTTGIMAFAEKSDAKEFIIGTENSIVQHLQYKCPDKRFYPLSKECICKNMKLTTLMDVLGCLEGTAGEVIRLDDDVREKAKRSLDNMIALG